jgi:hypothetical protein
MNPTVEVGAVKKEADPEKPFFLQDFSINCFWIKNNRRPNFSFLFIRSCQAVCKEKPGDVSEFRINLF